MNKMVYRGYTAKIEYSNEDDCFIGHIAGINDIVGFHGNSVNELHDAFEEAVDDYIKICEINGNNPVKAYSGKIMLRVPPEIHAKIAIAAQIHGKSLNSWLTELLSNAA